MGTDFSKRSFWYDKKKVEGAFDSIHLEKFLTFRPCFFFV